MRINFLLPSYATRPIGGYRLAYEIVSGLAARGYRAHLFLPRTLDRPSDRMDLAKSFAWIVRRRVLDGNAAPWFEFHPDVRVHRLRYISGQKIAAADFVCATGWNAAQAMAALSGGKGRKVHLVQDYEYWRLAGQSERSAIEQTFRGNDLVISTSAAVEEMLAECHVWPDASVRPGVDLELFRPLPDGPEQHSVALPIRPEEHKGSRDGLVACEALARRLNGRLVVHAFGATEPVEGVPWLRFHRNPDCSALRALIARCAAFLLPSRLEGFGMTGLEAMACGTPVVAADSVGVREYMEHGVNGYVAPAGDPAMLATHLESLLSAPPSRRAAMSSNARRTAARFTWTDTVDRFVAALESA